MSSPFKAAIIQIAEELTGVLTQYSCIHGEVKFDQLTRD